MAQPAHLVVVPVRTAPQWGAFVPPPTAELELSDRTRVARVPLPPLARWLVRVAVLAVAVIAPIVAFAGERKVSFDVEGEVRTIRTYAADANELLERRGLEAGKSDLLAPATDLADGGRVVYRKAKRIQLVLDGDTRSVVARGLTVGEAVKDLGLVPGPKDHLHPAANTPLRPGLEVFVRNAVQAKLRVDGGLRDVVSSADTIENLLGHAGVRLGPYDQVYPARVLEPTDGMWIRVVRVRKSVEERSVRVPFRYVTHEDADMESGVRRVVQQGAEGMKVQRFAVISNDGRQVSRSLLGETIVRQARDHIVRVGTREPTFKGGGGSQSGIASWFEADGLVAAHRSLPLGAVVKVINVENGKSVTVRINQRGPFVDGRVIDLSDDAFKRIAPLGQGTVKVKVQS